MKLRLLLTSALFLFAQMPTIQAQETLDLAKVTCAQILADELQTSPRDLTLLLVGYYNGMRNSTVIQTQNIIKNEVKVDTYCLQHSEATVMDAVKNLFGLGK